MSAFEENAIWCIIVADSTLVVDSHVDGEVDLGQFLGLGAGMLREELGVGGVQHFLGKRGRTFWEEEGLGSEVEMFRLLSSEKFALLC